MMGRAKVLLIQLFNAFGDSDSMLKGFSAGMKTHLVATVQIDVDLREKEGQVFDVNNY